ncbi:unnamed protein product [Peronospora belbahrii]|uniref:Crossover junction endonuclease MUS81-like HHH domain-containing protein n=1 Tax=Peronospora belbahrii TaxID=622444 RepID=A0ABN8D4V1_9STRA|nr:unnamed protein product [Peronospora belbahrii]
MRSMIGNDRQLSNLRETCTQSELVLPENINSVSTEISKVSCDDDEGAIERGTKRDHLAMAGIADVETKQSTVVQCTDGDIEEKALAEVKYGDSVDKIAAVEEGEEEDEGPPRKCSRLAEEVRKQPAAVPSNQVIVNAFLDSGDQELHCGRTGQGVAHLRAARSIHEYPRTITSGIEARDVPLVGAKMAAQIEQILDSRPVEVKKYTPPKLVQELRTTIAKQSENQLLVDELAKFGELELYFHDRGNKDTSRVQASREVQLGDHVTAPTGNNPRQEVADVGPVDSNDSEQIRDDQGLIVKDILLSGEVDQIMKNVDNTTQRSENEPIADTYVDDGDQHVFPGYFARGTALLRTAKAIRDADIVVTSGKQAAESIKAVDNHVVAKIDHILNRKLDDTDTRAPLQEACKRRTHIDGSQNTQDEGLAHMETKAANSTDQEAALDRAAHHLHDATEFVTSGSAAKALGSIGKMVVSFVNHQVGLTSVDDSITDDDDRDENK